MRILAGAQRRKFLGRVFDLEDFGNLVIHLAGGGPVILRSDIQHQDVLALFHENAGPGFLSQRALGDQRAQPCRALVILVPGIVRQRIAQRLDGQRHGVEADYVRGAIGGTLGAADRRPRQTVDHIEGQLELRGVMHGGRDRKHADAIGDEIRCVLGAHHALADGGGEEGFKLVKNDRLRRRRWNQLDQLHVTRRVEKMNAAKTMA